MLCCDTPKRSATSVTEYPRSVINLTASSLNSGVYRLSTHNVLSYAKRIDEICLGEWWQSKHPVHMDQSNDDFNLTLCRYIFSSASITAIRKFLLGSRAATPTAALIPAFCKDFKSRFTNF